MVQVSISQLSDRLCNSPLWLLIFLLTLINYWAFVPATNEENYLLWAAQSAQPEWIPGSFSATEFSGVRLLFERLFGKVIYHLGIENTVGIGRFLNYLAFAFPLAASFKELKFSKVQALFILQIFMVSKQSYYGGEWIFGGFEAKTVAYVFIFWALFYLLKERYKRAFLCLLGATWFHLLVGGWFALGVSFVLLLRVGLSLNWLKPMLLYGLATIPLLAYLATGIYGESIAFEAKEINLNHIYVYWRNKHHLGLFADFPFFFKRHFAGVLFASFSATALWVFSSDSDHLKSVRLKQFSFLRQLALIFILTGLFFVLICLADTIFFEQSGGFLLKAYPWRMQGLALLFFLMILIAGLWNRFAFFSAYESLILGLTILTAGIHCGLKVQKMLTYQNDSAYKEVLDYIETETRFPSTIMVLQNPEDRSDENRHKNKHGIDLMRRTRRDIFVHYKLVPSTPEKMLEWYKRLQVCEEIQNNPQALQEAREQYEFDYILCARDIELDAELVFENKKFRLYSKAK